MNVNAVYLKDSNDNIVSPVVSTNSIFDTNGNNLNNILATLGSLESVPVGTIIEYTNNSIPDNYLLCNGDEISRTTYSELFEVIGTQYGEGDGSTTFNLPYKVGYVSTSITEYDDEPTKYYLIKFKTQSILAPEEILDVGSRVSALETNVSNINTNISTLQTNYNSIDSKYLKLTGGTLTGSTIFEQPIKSKQGIQIVNGVDKSFNASTQCTITCDSNNNLNLYSPNGYILTQNLLPTDTSRPIIGSSTYRYGNTYLSDLYTYSVFIESNSPGLSLKPSGSTYRGHIDFNAYNSNHDYDARIMLSSASAPSSLGGGTLALLCGRLDIPDISKVYFNSKKASTSFIKNTYGGEITIGWSGSGFTTTVDGSTIGTLNYTSSDKRLKKDIQNIDTNVLKAISEVEIKQFRLTRINPDNKISFGCIAQDLISAFEKYGLNYNDYSLVLSQEYEDGVEYFSIDYTQFNTLKLAWLEYKLNNM